EVGDLCEGAQRRPTLRVYIQIPGAQRLHAQAPAAALVDPLRGRHDHLLDRLMESGTVDRRVVEAQQLLPAVRTVGGAARVGGDLQAQAQQPGPELVQRGAVLELTRLRESPGALARGALGALIDRANLIDRQLLALPLDCLRATDRIVLVRQLLL